MNPGLSGVKAIFFDAGGTLINLDSPRICALISQELGIIAQAEKFPRAQCGAMAEVARIVATEGRSTERLKREFYTTLLPEVGVTEEKLEAAIACVLKLAEAEMLWRKADEATAPALARLKERGLILAVVSNSDGRIESAFEQAGLTHYFDFFIDSYLVGVEKPDPQIFRIATEHAGVAPAEAAYVGDLYSVDVIGAQSAGLIPVLYDPFHLYPEADCITICAISDLIALLSLTDD